MLNEVLLGRLREGPGGQRGRRPGGEQGRRGRSGEAVRTLHSMCSSAEGRLAAAGSAIWSLACSGSPKLAVDICTFVPSVSSTCDTSTPLHLSHSTTVCFSKPCSVPAPLASLLASAPGTDLLGTPLDFQGASPPHYCYVLSGFIINFTYSGLSVPLVPHLIMDILILASEAHVTMGTKFAFNGLIVSSDLHSHPALEKE